MICTNCYTRAKPVTHTPGTFAVEFVLWCCFMVPGFFYSMWRLSARTTVCPSCRRPNMVSEQSARGLEITRRTTHLHGHGQTAGRGGF